MAGKIDQVVTSVVCCFPKMLCLMQDEDEIYLEVFFAYSQNRYIKESFIVLFSPEKLARLFLLKEFKPSPDRKTRKLPTVHNLLPAILTKTRSRKMTATTFSRQNYAGSRASTT